MRLGLYPCMLTEGSQAQQAYGGALVHERHRHRYEFNNVSTASSSRPTACIVLGHQPGRQAGRGDRAAGPSVVPGGAVPSGVQVEADEGHPLFRGFVKAAWSGARQKKKLRPPAAPAVAIPS